MPRCKGHRQYGETLASSCSLAVPCMRCHGVRDMDRMGKRWRVHVRRNVIYRIPQCKGYRQNRETLTNESMLARSPRVYSESNLSVSSLAEVGSQSRQPHPFISIHKSIHFQTTIISRYFMIRSPNTVRRVAFRMTFHWT
jgi:hypothetical protein